MTEVSTQSSPPKGQQFDHSDADLCVACGLCLPVCPTYRLSRDENESPRGRLSLIRALANGQLPPDKHLAGHLHRCTLCLSCESVCPAKVEFGEQMSRARDWLTDQGKWPHTLTEKFLLNSLHKGDTSMRRVGQLARTYQRSPIQRVLRGSGLLRLTGLDHIEKAMPQFTGPTEFRETYPAAGAKKGRVALFKGCLQDQTDPETLPAAIKLVTHLGYDVEIPASQSCCGGLHLHSGERDEAERLARNNIDAFSGCQHIIGVASGCGAVLKQYGELIGKEGESSARAYRDITAFL
ncbi:MAG: (Fe-S)-binding protein, partial [Acidiferrobacterales bacterium]